MTRTPGNISQHSQNLQSWGENLITGILGSYISCVQGPVGILGSKGYRCSLVVMKSSRFLLFPFSPWSEIPPGGSFLVPSCFGPVDGARQVNSFLCFSMQSSSDFVLYRVSAATLLQSRAFRELFFAALSLFTFCFYEGVKHCDLHIHHLPHVT